MRSVRRICRVEGVRWRASLEGTPREGEEFLRRFGGMLVRWRESSGGFLGCLNCLGLGFGKFTCCRTRNEGREGESDDGGIDGWIPSLQILSTKSMHILCRARHMMLVSIQLLRERDMRVCTRGSVGRNEPRGYRGVDSSERCVRMLRRVYE